MQRLHASAKPSFRISLGRVLRRKPMEELPELKSIRAVQDLVARIPMQPRPLFINENDAYLQWLNTHCSKSAYGAESQLGKDAFAVLIDGVGKYLLKREEIAFQECDKIGPMENDDLDCAKADAFVEAVKMKLSRHMCKQLEACFELLDKDKDGKVCFRDVEKLLQVVVHGNGTRWLKGQFQLYDADGEDVVNEAESRLILNSIIATQKAVMAEVFATHVDYMPKKSEKLFAKSLSEEDYRLKIPEKVRCVYHFANKVCKTNDWKLFLNSQKKEFPELHNLLAVYAKGFYNERYTYYERKQQRMLMLFKGSILATAIGLGDYIAAVI